MIHPRSLLRRRPGSVFAGALIAAFAAFGWVLAGAALAQSPPPGLTNPDPIWGYADLHAHTFANEAYGGKWFQGKPAFILPAPLCPPQLPIEECPAPILIPAPAAALGNCTAAHGAGHALDLFGLFNGQGTAANAGYPQFDGWPRWSSVDHQTMYYTWLKRAFDGGLRVMVMLAVNNEVLCEGSVTGALEGYGCEDMPAVDRQLRAARELEAAIDGAMGGPGKGWFRIVESPVEARAAIEADQLAVVLGIEVDNLFDCAKNASGCTPESVNADLDEYYALGVRHVFPVHVFDNGFGGAAIYNDTFNVGNHSVTGDWFQTAPAQECRDQGYEYAIANDTNVCRWATPSCLVAKSLLAYCPLIPFFPPAAIPCALGALGTSSCNHLLDGVCDSFEPTYGGESCNARGLTDLGKHAVRQMLARGMIIDIDHMSARATEDLLAIVEPAGCPVVASHTGFTAISHAQKNSEGQKSEGVVERLRELGALVAPILDQGTSRIIPETGGPFGEISGWGDPNRPYPPCSKSGWGWAQAYKYAVEKMGGAPVAFGSDFNGIVQPLAPRYPVSSLAESPPYTALGQQCLFPDHEAAGLAQSTQQGESRRLHYPFTLPGIVDASGVPVQFGRSNICEGSLDCKRGVNNSGELDFNVEGLAHVGLLPDFIADLQANGEGFTDAELAPLFHSAEAYIELWERVEGCMDPGPAACTGTVLGDLCLHRSEVGESCIETCDAAGAFFDAATAEMGSDGSDDACRAAWEELGAEPEVLALRWQDEPACTDGIGCHFDLDFPSGAFGRCEEPATSGAAASPGIIRVCACSDTPPPPPPTPACTGGVFGDDCLFMGELGESCGDTCSAAGLFYDPATADLGSDGSDQNCEAAWEAVGLVASASRNDAPACDEGVGCHAEFDIGTPPFLFFGRCSEPATAESASAPDVFRLCACSTSPPGIDTCGNGVADPKEECDGDDFHGAGCPAGLQGALLCSSDCEVDASGCTLDLSFCPEETILPADMDCRAGESAGESSYCAIDPPGPYALGATDISIACTDGIGTSTSCSSTVLVTDQAAPVITCPEDQTVECAGAGQAIPGFAASAADNCTESPATECVPAPGSSFPLGATAVVCSAVDASGNADSCVASVTVVDTQSPVLECAGAANATTSSQGGLCSANSHLSAVANDACGLAGPASCGPDLSLAQPGSTTGTCSARDLAGNSSVCLQTLTLVDDTPPDIECSGGAIVTTSSQGGVCSASTVVEATASDSCAGDLTPAITGCPVALSLPQPGITTATCIVADASGNAIACQRSLTLLDDTAPVLTCPTGITVATTAVGACTSPPLSYTVTGDDLCDGAGAVVATGMPPSGSAFPLGTTTVSASGADLAGNSADCSFPVTVEKIAADSGVTVTPASQQYSDRVTFTATLSPASCAVGGAPATDVTFYVGTQAMGTAPLLGAGGTLAGSLSMALLEPMPAGTAPIGQMAPGLRAVTAVFGGVNPNFVVHDATTTLTIEREDARATYTGAPYASTSSKESTMARVPLSATLEDISAATDAPASDPHPGDIRNATVRFEIVETGQVVSAPLGLVNSGDQLIGTATTDVAIDIGNSDSASYTVRVVVGGYYAASDEVTVVTVTKPGDSFVTGGGYLVLGQSAGRVSGDPGTHSNFRFNVKYKKGNPPQGQINAIVQRTEADGVVHVYQIDSDSMASLAAQSTATGRTATFSGDATLRDVTNPAEPVSVDGDAKLQVTLTDRGEPGREDSIAITLWDKAGGLWFASRWERNKTLEQPLAGGNLVVH